MGDKPTPPPLVPLKAQPASAGLGQDPDPPDEDELVLVLRPRPRNPTWLKAHQERLAKANQVAQAETAHLTGVERQQAFTDVISREMKRLKGGA